MKIKLIHIIPAVLLSLCLTSCDDWLDVRGENIQKEQDQFTNYKGFRDALTGCYMTMAGNDIYGERLTMTDIENLASLWYVGSDYETSAPLMFQLTNHQYSKDEARAAIKSIYSGLFNTITSVNVLLKNIDEKGKNITDPAARAMIEGEALAMRAYCQFDVLRLFGQLPQGGTKQVSLPYSYTTSINEMPAYYAYADYVERLKADIEKAETLLKENDPIMKSTFERLNVASGDVDDSYQYFRQSRLNYWAVRALHARIALYTGDNRTAHDIALDIINAKGSDGKPVISLSGSKDLLAGYNGLPSECLFYLSKYNLVDYSVEQLIGGSSGQARTGSYFVTNDMLQGLYESIPGSTASHNRYIYEWNHNTRNPSSTICPALKKYWYDKNNADADALMTKYQIIPMLRLSEMYLIGIETSTSLDEAQALYDTYMKSCSFTLYDKAKSVDELHAEMLNEYRRELFGEGQMFFTYKRHFTKTMKWNDKAMTEEDYILPLPSSEYDPSTIK